MIVHTDPDWSAWDLPGLQALQLSARQTLACIAPYLERLYSERGGLQEFQVEGLLFYAVELIDGVLVDPALPAEFASPDSQQHNEAQMTRWWHRPFVERNTWGGTYGLEDRRGAGQAALGQVFPELATRDVEKHIAVLKGLWFSDWPTSTRYEARCLEHTSPSVPNKLGYSRFNGCGAELRAEWRALASQLSRTLSS